MDSQTLENLRTRKTRIQALSDRIAQANDYVNSMIPETEQEQTEIMPSQKFLLKLNSMVKDLENVQKKISEIPKEEINEEINSLQDRSLIELSIAKAKMKDDFAKTQMELSLKDEQIRNLEVELICQRQAIENQKREEEKSQELIKNLQDQVAVLRSKAFGYDISKKYEYYKDKKSKGPVGNIEDENLAFAMWEKENYDNKRSLVNNSLEKLENSKNMWISGTNNTNRVVMDVDLANSYNNINAIKSTDTNGYSNWRRTNNYEKSLSGNMKKYAPMVFNK